MSRAFERELSALAASQCGVFSRAQVLACEGGTSLVKRRLASGAWEVRHPGVYAVSAVPPSWHQDVWAALLAIGPRATVSHETALRLHGLGDDLIPRQPLTFTIPHGGHARVAGAVVHQIDDLAPVDVGVVDGLPTSRPHRAVVEVAATVGQRRLGDIVDELLLTRRSSHERIAACLARVIRPGKPGVIMLGAVLDERGDGYVADASELERALFAALGGAGLPLPRRQVPLPGRGALDGLVDAVYDDAKVILEADGRRWHTRIRDLKRDHQRDAEAARVGWQTLRFLYEEIMGDPGDVCAVVRDVCAVRRRITVVASIASATRGNRVRAGILEAIGTAPGSDCLELREPDHIASGGRVDDETVMNKTALIDAIDRLDLQRVKLLLGREPALKQLRSDRGFDLLQMCCTRRTDGDATKAARQLRLARWLVSQGFDPHEKYSTRPGEDGEEPVAHLSLVFFAVARAQNNQLARFFLEQGAAPGALFAAAWWGNWTIIKDLVRHGADVDEVVGGTPLHMAVAVLDRGVEGRPERARRRLKVLKELLRLGADPNIRDDRGQTPLHRALEKGYDIEVFELLLKHGASPDIAGKDGRTVRDIASRKRDKRYFHALGGPVRQV